MTKNDQYEQIWTDYRRKLIVFVRGFASALNSEAEDIAEEILLKVFQKLDSFSGKYSFSTWLYSIAHNYCIDYIRKNSKGIHFDNNDQFNTWRENPEQIFLRDYEESRISDFIQNLESKDYRITFLRFYEELSIKEIAIVLNIPEGTVKYRIHEVKKNLKNYLEGENEREEKYSRS